MLEAGSNRVVCMIDDVLVLAAMEKGNFAIHLESCKLVRWPHSPGAAVGAAASHSEARLTPVDLWAH